MRHKKVAINRRGTAAVEFAVVAPLLVFMLIGLWEVGRIVEIQQLLVNAVREGGRQASTGVKTSDQVKQIVVNYLQQYGMTSVTTSDVTVTNLTTAANPPDAATQLDQFRVSITISFDSYRWVVLKHVSNVSTLTASADWYSMEDIPITVSSTIPTT